MNEAVIAQVLETLNRIETKVDTHISEEAELRATIENNKHEAETRHSVLIQSIHSYMDKQSIIETAFLKTHDGMLDVNGHYQDHHERKSVSDWLREARNKSLLKVAEYGTLTFFCWLVYQVWKTILKGPSE